MKAKQDQGSSSDSDWDVVVPVEIISKSSKIQPLPYSPFVFDFNLVICSYPASCPEFHLKQFLLNRKQILGRKGKDIDLPLPTVSGSHCQFDNNSIRDLGSKAGTYIWCNTVYNKKIKAGDSYYIGGGGVEEHPTVLKIVSINQNENGQSIARCDFGGRYVDITIGRNGGAEIGSNRNCKLQVNSMADIQGVITENGTIRHGLDTDQARLDTGIWHRLSEKGETSEPVKLERGMVIRVETFIFKIQY